MLFTVQVAYAAESWKARHGRALRDWVDAVGEMEALLSLSGYSYEHPADPFPELLEPGDDGAVFDGADLAHPLLPSATAVSNSVGLGRGSPPKILIVSGSNMSGKSTLMRTVGLNAVLALAGAPVRASRLRLTPLAVGTCLRHTDSLHEGRSGFYTEVLRIRLICDLLDGPRPVLFLFDELLSGTNSKDRRIAAEGLVRMMLARRAIGMVTTHDLALTEIAAIFPEPGPQRPPAGSRRRRPDALRLQAARRHHHAQQRARADAHDRPRRVTANSSHGNTEPQKSVFESPNSVFQCFCVSVRCIYDGLVIRSFALAALLVLEPASLSPKTARARGCWSRTAGTRSRTAAPRWPPTRSRRPSRSIRRMRDCILAPALAAYLQRRDADAKAALEQALQLDPKLTDARAQLAHVLRRQQDFKGAINLYEVVVTEVPTMPVPATRSSAGSASSNCTSACGSPSAITSPSRSRGAKTPTWRRRRSNRSTARSGASATCSAHSRPSRFRWCCTAASSFATSPARRRGRPPRTTARSACRCAARSTRATSSIACSRTSSRTR